MNVVSFYRFTNVTEPQKLRDELQRVCDEQHLLGTILVAEEGVNGTLAGDESWLESELSLAEPIEGRWTEADEAPFKRMRVRLKKEIVALGRPDIRPDPGKSPHIGPQEWNSLIADPNTLIGRPDIRPDPGKSPHIGPQEWNSLIADPNTLIIDTRNHYEIEVGTFPNAIDPQTDSFRQFQDFAEHLADVSECDRSANGFIPAVSGFRGTSCGNR
jgi:UPF0176 protein